MFDKFSSAPLFGYTDKYCIFFYRLFTKYIKLYTEMIHVSSFIKRYRINKLYFINEKYMNVAIQFVGNKYQDLFRSSCIVNKLNISEINFNLGCPSIKANYGEFGVYLTKNINKIVNCLNYLQNGAPDITLSIKHRINFDCYNYLLDFVGYISLYSSCKKFIIHARSVLNNNYSTKDNLVIPVLNYNYVYKLKKDLPYLNIVINGNINNLYDIDKHLKYVDGVMMGRGLYFNPLFLFNVNKYFRNRYYLYKYKNIDCNNSLFFDKKKKISINIRLILFKVFYYIKSNPECKKKPFKILRHVIHIFYKTKNASFFRRRLIMSLNLFEKFNCYLDFEFFMFKGFF